MILRTLTITLLLGLPAVSHGSAPKGEVDAADHGAPWSCKTADPALRRKSEVTKHLTTRVAFIGEAPAVDVESRMALHRVPAFSVAVIHDGALDWSASWGVLHHDGASAGCNSLFQAGSLAKPATALAALRMQDAGMLTLDADIGKYLASWKLPPGQQDRTHPVTLRHLLAHTAGITPGGYAGYAQGAPMPTDQQTVEAAPPSNARKVEVLAVPGTLLRYSGGGYTVAEIALQDHLHQSFEQLMQAWLLSPVGMRQADFHQPLPERLHGHAARGHQADGSVVAGGWRNHPEQAAAGLWATASDLAQLLIELRKGWLGQSEVFSQASVRELLAAPFDGHAYGFRLIGEGDAVFITHYGSTVGYRAGMTMNLSTGNGAAFLANSDNGGMLGEEFFASVAKVYGWPEFQLEQVQVQRATQTPAVLASLTGRYQFPDGPAINVVHEAGALALSFPNGDRYVMAPIVGEAREFIHAATGVRARFDGQGKAATIHLYGETAPRVAMGE